MKRYIFLIFFVICFLKLSVSVKSNITNDTRNFNESEDLGEALFLTDYIENGKLREGLQKSRVYLSDFPKVESYSGFLTVNKTYNSNIFFWFFPSQRNATEDPVMLWMIGGPGITVFNSIFIYNGPLGVTDEGIFERKNCYNTNHSVLYIDNPVGSGYSFTENEAGIPSNSESVAKDVLEALKQFFQIFSDYRKNKFIVGGDSYGGKYVVTIADAIKKYNADKNNTKINMHGLVIGNGIIQPHEQTHKADYLYQLGLFDENQRDEFKAIEINPSGKSQILAEMFQNFTGYEYEENVLNPLRPHEAVYTDWVNKTSIRKALHVGHYTYYPFNLTVYQKTNDKGQSVSPIIEKLLNEYKVLFYHGQLDAHIPYTSSMKVFRNFTWNGAEKYKTAKREKIIYNYDLAGYWKVADNLNDVLVREAGHVASYEQLEWCSKIISKFTDSI